MQAKLFYSWQSDISGSECSTLITNALSASTRALLEDGTAQIVPVIDRDTLDVPGAPDIGVTIFDKIRHADVFVADVTIIGRISGRERPTPNPNVLIETGYALAALGPGRVLLVMNTGFGLPELLPFDLRQRRTLTFETGADDAERDAAQRHLTSQFRDAVAPILRERANTHAGDDPRVARWRRSLMAAQSGSTWVDVESEIVVDTGYKDNSGQRIAAPAVIGGIVRVRAINEHAFDLGIPMRGRSGVTIAPVPFAFVDEIWDGAEGHLHVMLKRPILIKDDSSGFL